MNWTVACSGSDCSINGIYWTETEYCYTESDSESGWNGDDYEGDSLEPSEGGDPGFPLVEPTHPLDEILRNHNLTPEQLNTLRQTLSEILDSHCVYRKMYEFLFANEVRFDFFINPNTSAGGYNPLTQAITFNNAGTLGSISTLTEELFHAYQDYYYSGGIYQYNHTSGFSNIEFEAKFFQDIINFMSTGSICCAVFPNTSTVSSSNFTLYQTWLDEITSFGTEFPEFSTVSTAYFQWMQVFANTNIQYNFPINSTLLPNSAFNLLNSNCN